jgi:hypothetical protein
MDKAIYTIIILLYVFLLSILSVDKASTKHAEILQQIDNISIKLNKLEDKL